MNITISKTLEEAVKTRNISRIHSVFYTIAHEDPTFETGKFRESLRYVQAQNIKGVFDIYDKKIFLNETEWNEDYWAEVASELVDNFCMERINHLEKIGKKVFPNKLKRNSSNIQKTTNYVNKKSNYSVQKTREKRKENKKSKGSLFGILWRDREG